MTPAYLPLALYLFVVVLFDSFQLDTTAKDINGFSNSIYSVGIALLVTVFFFFFVVPVSPDVWMFFNNALSPVKLLRSADSMESM